MKGQAIFLGTGGSVGVPLIGCQCSVCTSSSPFNQRLRPSIFIRLKHKQFLVDAGPDFRLQALYHGITTFDGLLLTHAHNDHIAGLDDLRPIYYKQKNALPVLLSAETAQGIKRRYDYLFYSEDGQEYSHPMLQLQLLPDQLGQTMFEGLCVRYVTYSQGSMMVNGYRFGDLAYLSDIRHFSVVMLENLRGIKKLIISALRYTPSPLHFSVDEAIDFAKELKVEQAWLTHLSHDLDYEQTNAYLPANIRLAYDGLKIDFEEESYG